MKETTTKSNSGAIACNYPGNLGLKQWVRIISHCAIASFFLFNVAGCDVAKKKSKTTPVTQGADDHADHDHAAAHGGHHIHLSPSGAGAEWAHNEDGTISIYLEEVVAKGYKVDGVMINSTVQGSPTKTYNLASANADAHKIEGAIFTIKDMGLLTALEVGENIQIELVVKINGVEQRAKLEHHHDEHGAH